MLTELRECTSILYPKARNDSFRKEAVVSFCTLRSSLKNCRFQIIDKRNGNFACAKYFIFPYIYFVRESLKKHTYPEGNTITVN